MYPMIIKRIKIELIQFNREPEANCYIEVIKDNLSHLQVTFIGPKGTPYEKGLFVLDIKIPNNYPFMPPSIRFKTKIFHLNVHSRGRVSLEVLHDKWYVAFTIPKLITIIKNRLERPEKYECNNSDAFSLYSTDIKKYNATAKEWCLKYAS